VHIAYIDESDHGLSYWVYSLVVSESEILNLQNTLNEYAASLPIKYHIDSSSEFHGYDILNGVGDWADLKNDYSAQMEIFENLIYIILSYDIRFIAKGVSRSRFVPRYGDSLSDIHHAALTWNIEKIQNFVSRESSIAIVIADETTNEEIHQRNISLYRTIGTFGWDSTALKHFADTLYFCPSKTSRLLQAVDILAYAHKVGTTQHLDPRSQAFYNRMWATISDSRKIEYLGLWI
jgi:hypothetical protein